MDISPRIGGEKLMSAQTSVLQSSFAWVYLAAADAVMRWRDSPVILQPRSVPTVPTSSRGRDGRNPYSSKGVPTVPTVPTFSLTHTRAHLRARAMSPVSQISKLSKRSGQSGQSGQLNSSNGFGCPDLTQRSGRVGTGILKRVPRESRPTTPNRVFRGSSLTLSVTGNSDRDSSLVMKVCVGGCGG